MGYRIYALTHEQDDKNKFVVAEADDEAEVAWDELWVVDDLKHDDALRRYAKRTGKTVLCEKYGFKNRTLWKLFVALGNAKGRQSPTIGEAIGTSYSRFIRNLKASANSSGGFRKEVLRELFSWPHSTGDDENARLRPAGLTEVTVDTIADVADGLSKLTGEVSGVANAPEPRIEVREHTRGKSKSSKGKPTQRVKASEQQLSILILPGYSPAVYDPSIYHLPLLYDRVFVYGPTYYGCVFGKVEPHDFVKLALSKDDPPAIVPISFPRFMGEEGKKHREELYKRIESRSGAEEAMQVLYQDGFDDVLEPLYRKAQITFEKQIIEAGEDLEKAIKSAPKTFVTDEYVERFAQLRWIGPELPPEIERYKPEEKEWYRSDAWYPMALNFLKVVIGDKSIAANLREGCKTQLILPPWRPYYELVDEHLQSLGMVGAAAPWGTGVSDEPQLPKGFRPDDFLNDVFGIEAGPEALDQIRSIRGHGRHKQFQQWMIAMFQQENLLKVGVPAGAVMQALKHRLKIRAERTLKLVWRIVEGSVGEDQESLLYSVIAGLLGGKRSRSINLMLTKSLGGEYMKSEGVHQMRTTILRELEEDVLPGEQGIGFDYMFAMPFRFGSSVEGPIQRTREVCTHVMGNCWRKMAA
jgi:hypothetical protein